MLRLTDGPLAEHTDGPLAKHTAGQPAKHTAGALAELTAGGPGLRGVTTGGIQLRPRQLRNPQGAFS